MIDIAVATCFYCSRRITGNLDGDSALDWSDNGDYGCGKHPLSDAYGVYGHVPMEHDAIVLQDAINHELFGDRRLRGDAYIAAARELARKLKVEEPD